MSAPPWAAGGRGGCAPTRSSSSRACPPTRRPARQSSRSSSRPPRPSRASRSTRPFSTSAACGASPARRSRWPSGFGARCSRRSAWPSRSASPGPSSSPRSPAGSPSPTASSSFRPPASSPSCTPSPSSVSGASGPVTSRKLRALGLETVGQVAELKQTALMELLGKGSGRHIHALAHNRDPRRVRRTRRRSMGSQHALGRRSPKSPEALDTVLVGLVDRIGRRLRAARQGVPHGGAAAALRRLHARDPLPHDDRGHGPDPDDPLGRAGPPGGGHAPDRTSGRDARRHLP